ncbi:MAG: RHS repeat-associated core domain-containing protein [Mariprofundales bacterium]
MTDINGTKVWDMQQTPVGITTINNDAEGNGTAVNNNFRVPGQYFDAETGLSYNYFRTYDATLGRYTQSDPIGLNGGLNVFGYVGGRPNSFVDTMGLDVTGTFSKENININTTENYEVCNYYQNVADVYGCIYHANAYDICRGHNNAVTAILFLCGVSNQEENLIRSCLVDSDKHDRDNPNCQTGQGSCSTGNCTTKTCIDSYHVGCFVQSGVPAYCYGGVWGDYPNDGN